MELSGVNQFLLLTSWFMFAGLIFLLGLIARFYQNLANKKTYYQWYWVPIITMAMSTARYASIGQWGYDWLGDGLGALSGILVVSFCYFLYRQMTNRRK